MEKELNIAAILKDKPKGTKLWSDTFGIVSLLATHSDSFDVKDANCTTWGYSSDGSFTNYKGALCIFPSREMRDWEKFAWKKGDVLRNIENDELCVFDKFNDDKYDTFKGLYNSRYQYSCRENATKYWGKVIGEQLINSYIAAIEKQFCGKLNLSTLHIEQPKQEFKDGDIVVYGKSVAICRKVYKHTLYFYASLDEMLGLMFDHNNVSVEPYRLATDSEKQQLFSALEKEGKVWNPDTLQIEDLPKKCEFKPMDWCLMRFRHRVWHLCQFAFINKSLLDNPVAVGGNIYEECIPYNDQTKHLLGTTDEWKGGSHEQ